MSDPREENSVLAFPGPGPEAPSALDAPKEPREPKEAPTEFEDAFDALAAAAMDAELMGAVRKPPSEDGADLESSEADAGMGEAAPRRAGTPKPWTVPADGASAGTVVPFRRPKKGSKIRRRRKSVWARWMMPFAAACLIVGIPTAFVFWLLSAPSFAMTDLVVKTAPQGRVSSEWVRNALRRDAGSNLWRLDLEALESRLTAHPWLLDVGLRKQPPSKLVVELVERRPAALYRAKDGLAWVDSAGRVIEPVDLSRPQPGLDLPILSGPEDLVPGALGILSEIRRAKTAWGPGLSEVEILGPRDFRLYTTALPFPLVVRQGSLEKQARHLRALLPRLASSPDAIDAVDLRFARRIIIKLESHSPGRSDEQRA
ncbi:MAG: FtsQ-type POTRA domain-containing protein [Acidobacteriota bacterium]